MNACVCVRVFSSVFLFYGFRFQALVQKAKKAGGERSRHCSGGEEEEEDL